MLGQLGHRVQHALRAFTPRDQKAVKAAATTFRANPAVDVETAITQLGVGEALVSFLDEKGTPGIVQRALIYPPQSQLPPLDEAERKQVIAQSLVAGHYEKEVDRASAFEMLKARAEQQAQAAQQEQQQAAEAKAESAGTNRQGFAEAFGKSVVRAAGSQIGRSLIRGVMGSLFGGGGSRKKSIW